MLERKLSVREDAGLCTAPKTLDKALHKVLAGRDAGDDAAATEDAEATQDAGPSRERWMLPPTKNPASDAGGWTGR